MAVAWGSGADGPKRFPRADSDHSMTEAAGYRTQASATIARRTRAFPIADTRKRGVPS